jgi:PAS domain S-box-containing protein
MLLLAWLLCFSLPRAIVAAENRKMLSPSALTPAKSVYELSPEEASKKSPVRVQGVVTFFDPERRLLFIQDASSGLYISWSGEWQKLHAGQQLEVIGTTDPGAYKPVVVAREFIPGKEEVMPTPIRVTVGDMVAGKCDGQWVEVKGRVRAVSNDSGRTQLMLLIEGRRTRAIIQDYPDQTSYGLLDADIIVRGVCGIASDTNRQPNGFTLFIPGRDCLTIEKINRVNPNSLPRRDIGSIPNLNQALRGNRIRLLGVITSLETNNTGCVVQDQTGSIRVKMEGTPNLRTNMYLDAIGYLNTNGTQPFIEDATLRWMGSGSMVKLDATNQTMLASLKGHLYPFIRQASSVRRLKPALAEEGYPVQIRGVVTYYDFKNYLLFIQDETGGIFILAENAMDIAAGQRVIVQGYSAPGDYAPLIRDPCFQILGTAPMPAAQIHNYDLLATGSMDSQWIEIQGVVQNQQYDGRICEMEIGATNGISFKTTVLLAQDESPHQLTGAKVRIRGVCASNFNDKRQLVGFKVYSPSFEYVTTLRAGSNPYDLPIQAITNLVQFKPDKTEAERERFKGVVTAAQKDGSFYLEDDTGGLLVQLVKPQAIFEGDCVEVTGFAESTGLSPSLRNAELRKIGMHILAPPVDLTSELASTNAYENILKTIARHDSKRIAIQGTLLNKVAGPVESVYLIQIGSTIVDVHWEQSKDKRDMPNLLPGSLVQATGVALFKIGRDRTPQSVGILLPSALNLKLLRPPPGWILEKAVMVIGCLLAASLVGLTWTLTLRRKVQRQTATIQQRLEREAALEKRYGDLVENAHDIIFTIDTVGNITSMNKTGEEATGYSRTETKGMSLRKLLPPNHPEWIEKLVESEAAAQSHTQTLELLAKDGTRIMVEASTRAVQHDGQLLEIQIIARDVSERAHLEMQLRQAQKMESVGQLAAGVAHDFNNILTIIQGHASMLANQGKDQQGQGESLKEIATAADRAAKLTKQLLAFSRKQMWQPCPLSMHALVHNLAKMLSRALGEHIQLDIRIEPDLPLILADTGMMEQVLMNLAVNARDAMPEGGVLCIGASPIQADEAQTLKEGLAGAFIRVDVIDQGSGMDANTLSHLFEPFFTTKSVGKGTGLGLATAYGIVKQHQGWIEVKSEPGKGTSFHIYLPVTDKPAAMLAETREDQPETIGHETILLVEDEAQLRELARKILVGCGYEVLTASNGGEALGMWELQKTKPDLLFTDMVMPGGINGRQLATRLQAKQPGLKVLFASGYSQELNRENAGLQVGVNFLAKPYPLQTLVKTVRTCLDA